MNTGTSSPLVSAIVSTYNAERFLRGKLEDLEAQTIADQLEIIVVDSGSRQNERGIVEEFQRRYDNIRYIRTERRETVYQAWNRGILASRGEFVTNANTDDRLRRDCYEILVRTLREHPHCVLAYPDMRITKQENATFDNHEKYGFKDWPAFDRISLMGLCCVGPFPLWRKSLHDEIGHFDERYKSAADYEFWLRAALRHDFVHVPQFLGLYWLSEETVSRNGDLPTLEYMQVQKEYRPKYAALAPPPEALTAEDEERYRELAALARDNFLAAAEGLNKFALLHPRWPRVHQDLAEFYCRNGRIGYAREHFEKAAVADLGCAEHRERLQAFLRTELYRSLQQYSAQAAAEPDNVEPHLTMGMMCALLERYEAARGHYLKALDIDPCHAPARANLAWLDAHRITSIAVLVGDGIDFTRECLESIERNTPEPHELIVLDRGSSDGTLPRLRELCAGIRHATLIEDAGAAAFRIGIQRARGSRIVLLSSDVVVTRGWLSGLISCLEREQGAALVAPFQEPVTGPEPRAGYGTIEALEEYAASFRYANLGRRLPVETLPPFCVLFEKPAWGSPEVAGAPQYPDNLDDLSLYALLAGQRLVMAGDVFLHHYGRHRLPGRSRNPILDRPSMTAVVTLHEIAQAKRMARQGALGGALDLLRQETGCSSADASRHLAAAGLLAEAGQHAAAHKACAALPAEDEAAALVRGAALCALGRHAEAEEIAGFILRRKPQSAPALHVKGEVAAARGEGEKAEELYRRATLADPGFGPAYTGLAVLAWEKGALDQALSLAEAGFLLAPLSMKALDRFHTYAVACGALQREEKRVREARWLYPDHKGLAYGLIEILLRRASFRDAIDEIERCAVQFPMDDGGIDAALQIRRLAGEREPARRGTGSVSLCMIVKDEARHLPAALHSVKGLVDEIVVVDTGCNDRTGDLARIFGARLFFFPWNGSFSDARNFSLSKAQGDWILVLDADEVLSPRDLAPLASLLKRQKSPVAYSFTTRNYTGEITRKNWCANTGEYPDEERGSGWTPSEKVRLFPNDSMVRFEGAVHELLETSLVACGIPIHACDVPVHHYGKLDAQKCAEKQQHYYRLGMKKFRETGGSVEAVTELARQATELQNLPEAEGLWGKVLEARPEDAEAYFNLAYLYLAAGHFGEARAHAARAAELAPDMKEALFNLGKAELFLGAGSHTLARCEEMLGRWPEYPPALSLLVAALLTLGRRKEAEAVMEKLSQMGYDCCDFLMEYAGGLQRGEHASLAAPLLAAAEQVRYGHAEAGQELRGSGSGF